MNVGDAYVPTISFFIYKLLRHEKDWFIMEYQPLMKSNKYCIMDLILILIMWTPLMSPLVPFNLQFLLELLKFPRMIVILYFIVSSYYLILLLNSILFFNYYNYNLICLYLKQISWIIDLMFLCRIVRDEANARLFITGAFPDNSSAIYIVPDNDTASERNINSTL